METEFKELCGAEDLLESFPLHRACRDGDLCTLAGLLGEAVVSVCDATAQDPLFGWTPAHWAAHNGKVECLEMLVKAGLPCDIATHGTALTLAHVAALEGQTACLAWLSKNGVSINAQDHMGETAAHKAVRCGSVECLHILNQHGADLSVRSSIGSTVIDLAVQNHQTQCIEYFKAGGDSHLTNHMTCMNGRRKRMQTGEEAQLDMDSAKRAKVESDYTLKRELYAGTKDSTRQLDQMMSNGVSGVGSSTIQHHKNGYSKLDRSDSTATEEESNMTSCKLQEHASPSSLVCSPLTSRGMGTCKTIAGHHRQNNMNGINSCCDTMNGSKKDNDTVVPRCQPVFSRRPLQSMDFQPSCIDMITEESRECSNGYSVDEASGQNAYNTHAFKSDGSSVHTMSNGAMEHNEMVEQSVGYDTSLEAMYSYDSPLCGHAY